MGRQYRPRRSRDRELDTIPAPPPIECEQPVSGPIPSKVAASLRDTLLPTAPGERRTLVPPPMRGESETDDAPPSSAREPQEVSHGSGEWQTSTTRSRSTRRSA